MANTKVTGDVIANGTISTVHLADDAITAAKLDSTATGITFADLTVDTDTLYVDAANNRVGIGETSPLSKLHIKVSDTGVTSPSAQGNLLVLEDSENGLSILSSTAGAGYINFGDSDDNDVGMIIYGHSSNSMDFWTNAGKRMTIDSSGNVGIGTASPGTFYPGDHNLVVGDGNADSAITVYANPANTSYLLFADGTSGADTYTAQVRYNHSTNHMEFATNNSTTAKMTLDDFGNLGIGTTSITNYGSTYKNLDVSGSNGAYLTLIGTTNTVKVDIAAETNAGYVGTKTAHPFIFRANDVERMRIDSNGDVQFNGSTVISSNTSDGSDNAVISLAGGGANSDGRGARMRLYGNEHASLAGVVDLATGNIAGADMYLTATDSMILNTGGSERMRIRSDGYIQQGIAGTSTNAYYFFDTINYGDSGIIFRDNTSTNSGYLTYNHGQDAMKFAANGSERMRIDSSGRVGIGTTSPSEKLEVSGVIKSISTGAAKLILNGDTNNSGDTGQEDAIIDFLGDGNPGIYGYRINTENWSGQTALHFQEYINGSYTSRLKIDKDGNVGINQTSPAAKLDVYGALKAQRFFSRNGSFSSTAGNWHNVVDLQQSEYENRTLICSIYTNGTHSYASATVNCAWNGGSFVLTLGNKIAGGSTDIRVSGGYLQFYTPWTSSTNFWRITIN
jgi:hypothetical protein